MEPKRCVWADGSALERAYHDREWGVPLHDNRRLFEMLTLEGAQAGLSWRLVLSRRERYREAFFGFDIERVAAMTDDALDALLADPSMIRNRLKIWSVRANARAALEVAATAGSLDQYLWSFLGGRPIVNRPVRRDDIPARTELSDRMSKALQKRGFKFVGSTICYAFMQATGMVNDHTIDCFRHAELAQIHGARPAKRR
ncbi:MAG: DNA-3-methyladenine glycosylase I [Acetobacteraceae bacterium]|nr:DNA-3-methyladenine glycosylase I [Acetobacteraceae bacterium]